ncbi:acetyl-CoA carboxylase biotin carboxyl carrier protein [Candidatus Chlorohelix sp.]|uniref:acetyl-CoA carboxylase biotin carboxyl carrier protein n=1 Tax=Candidatus Chlorohelix sp. TaxID=3139201 RepID=UPI003047EBEC
MTTSSSSSQKSSGEPENGSSSSGNFLTEEIRELIKMVEASDITELAIENGSHKLLIKREKTVIQALEVSPSRVNRAARGQRNISSSMDGRAISDSEALPEDSFRKLVAPMVGTFYRSPDPKARSFVNEGEMVEKGQVIGIIEAMKIMNEITSDYSGRCVKVSVENGQPVEYGQTLFLLESV